MIAKRVIIALLVLILFGGVATALYHLAGGLSGTPSALWFEGSQTAFLSSFLG